jgi:2-aminomuconate deaminase
VVVVVTSLSNRLFTDWIDPKDDRIHSPKDEEWNAKVLEFLGEGRLEDVAQLSRQIQSQVRVHKVVNFKPMWWLAAVMGQHNRYEGEVLAYAPIHGTGATVTTLVPSSSALGDKEFDEDDVEVYGGDRSVLDRSAASDLAPPASDLAPAPSPVSVATGPSAGRPEPSAEDPSIIRTDRAAAPVGAYPHARRVGDLLYLSGVGPRHPVTNEIPQGIEAQTRAVIANVEAVLEAAGSSLDKVVDVTVFLVDMDRDFAGYNAVYRDVFEPIQATRTTLAVRALPTPIDVEFKVIARP